MSKVGSWSTTASSNNATPPDGWPEGQAPSTVNDCAREMMAAIRTYLNDAQFLDINVTPTQTTSTTFTVTGDQTSAIHAGRRLKLFDYSTLYATVTSSTFTANTRVTAIFDGSTSATSSLSSFALSIISAKNTALPNNVAKVWGNVFCDITATATTAFNVSSVDRSALGVYRVNFAATMLDALYMPLISTNSFDAYPRSVSATATYLKFSIVNPVGSPVDAVRMSFVIYR